MTLQPLKAAKPLQATKLTPNLIVSSVERSLAFYTEVLGFARGITVPEESPLFIEVEEVDPLHERLKSKPNVTIVMPIVTQWYGMREFAIADPDGYVITFAQRVEQP
ncbi:MAG: hypothetical protein DMF99_14775 [Acidobacteria bacterium]|nr:MAG: hypothetical protein DMF99_14775 [Acidobacteriota bacterium]